MRPSDRQSGFTLTEVIVVSLLGVVVAVLFLSFMRVHNGALNEGVARGRLQMQSELAGMQIGRTARAASLILAADETWSSAPSFTERSVSDVVFYDDAGNVLGAVGIAVGIAEGDAESTGRELMEGSSADALTVLVSGGDTLRVTEGSAFDLPADRRGVILNLAFTIDYRDQTYTIPARRDRYQCRN